LSSIQPGEPFVLTQFDMVDENIGWGVEATSHRLRTIDGGSTWKDVTPPEVGFFSAEGDTHAWDVIQTRISCDQIGCSGGWAPGLVTWHTSDGGQTWQRGAFFNGGVPEFRPIVMQFVSDTTGWFLFVDQVGMSGFTFESLVQTLDGGDSWRLIQPLSNGCLSRGMIFMNEQDGWIGDDCSGLSNVITGTLWEDFLKGKEVPLLNRTSDGGNTWNTFALPAPTVFPSNFTSPALDPNVSLYCGIKQMDKISQMAFILQWGCKEADPGASAKVLYAYLTPDGGQTWHSWLSTGNESFINPDTGWRLFAPGDGQPNSLQQTADGGLTWRTIKAVAWQTAQFDFVSEQVGWAIVSDTMSFALVHTVDGGKTWIEIKPVIAP